MTFNVSAKIKRVFKTAASVLVIIALCFALMDGVIYAGSQSNDKWSITIGDKSVLYVDSLESGNRVIAGLKNYYLSKGYTLINCHFDPEIKVIKASTDSNMQGRMLSYEEGSVNHEIVDVNEAIDIIKSRKLVKIKTVERITKSKSIDYKTVYKKSSKVRKTTSKVSSKGVKGRTQFIYQVTKVDGVKTKLSNGQYSELISKATVKKAKTKVVIKGTGSVTAKAGKTILGTSGKDVVSYSKKFVGNPYVYGGTSLTRGCDCSGFVQSIYKHFGVNVPRTNQTTVGKSVKLKSIKPGDIVKYSNGHMAIYVGKGKVVHAVNERLGIKVTGLRYTGKVVKVTRIFS